jgi:hypothetical protein
VDAQPNEKLAAVMRRLNCTNSGLAKRVRDVAWRRRRKTLKTDHILVKKWLDGTSPRPETALFIAEALSDLAGYKISLDDIGMRSGGADPSIDSSLVYPATTSDGQAALAALVRYDLTNDGAASDVPVVPSAWTDLLVSWLLSRSRDFHDRDTGIRRVGMTEVEAIRVTNKAFMQLDFQFGGGHARPALVKYFEADVLPLLDGSYTETVGRHLFSAAAEVAQLLGWTAYDSERHGIAQRYLVQALHLAHAGGDRVMGGRILSNMSHQATYLGRFNEAAQLARAAQEGAKGVATATVMAMLLAMEARAQAGAQDDRACSVALREAEAIFAMRSPCDDPAWISYFDESEMAGEASHCFRDLRQPDVAAEFIQQAVALTDPSLTRTLAFIRLVHAASCLHDSTKHRADADEAVSIATEAIRLAGTLKSRRYIRYVRDLCLDFWTSQ